MTKVLTELLNLPMSGMKPAPGTSSLSSASETYQMQFSSCATNRQPSTCAKIAEGRRRELLGAIEGLSSLSGRPTSQALYLDSRSSLADDIAKGFRRLSVANIWRIEMNEGCWMRAGSFRQGVELSRKGPMTHAGKVGLRLEFQPGQLCRRPSVRSDQNTLIIQLGGLFNPSNPSTAYT